MTVEVDLYFLGIKRFKKSLQSVHRSKYNHTRGWFWDAPAGSKRAEVMIVEIIHSKHFSFLVKSSLEVSQKSCSLIILLYFK